MTPQERHQAARNASEALRELVGTPWTLGAVSLADSEGLDCIGLMVEAYNVIGRHLEEPELWRFPIPQGYPYPAELPEGGWLPENDIAEWHRHFLPTRRPAFGLGVTFLADHIGVLIEPQDGHGLDVLHSHRTSGVVLHPLSRLAQWASGFYELRPPADSETETSTQRFSVAGGEVGP